MQTLVARLQSQLERGEAVKQSLECDLTIVKKKLSDVTRSTTHKEVALAKQTIQLSGGRCFLIYYSDKFLFICKAQFSLDEKLKQINDY